MNHCCLAEPPCSLDTWDTLCPTMEANLGGAQEGMRNGITSTTRSPSALLPFCGGPLLE